MIEEALHHRLKVGIRDAGFGSREKLDEGSEFRAGGNVGKAEIEKPGFQCFFVGTVSITVKEGDRCDLDARLKETCCPGVEFLIEAEWLEFGAVRVEVAGHFLDGSEEWLRAFVFQGEQIRSSLIADREE